MGKMDPAEVIMEDAKTRLKPIMEAAARGDSDVQKFYSGSTVLVTGGTGFLGKLLIEKLIRACDVEKIFVITRPKKGMAISERINVLLKDSAFDTLREMQPDFGNKIIPIEGDVAELQLGLKVQDCVTITEEVDIIFHMAATTRFDETLQRATLINVRGTREVLVLAKQCKKLRSFEHVSTAYCQATRERIKSDMIEEFYTSPMAPDALISIAESMDNNRLVSITKQLIEGWPNTYTFTKAVAEELLQHNVGQLPACVTRPPVVGASYYEPSPGWNEPANVYGATGWFLTFMIGLAHVVLNANVRACLAPADHVTNAVIATAAETYKRHGRGDKELKIYCISSGLSFDFGAHRHFIRSEKCRSLVSPKSVWYCAALETNNKFMFWFYYWLFHYIPAYLIDAVFFLLRLKLPKGIPSVVSVYTKIYKTTLVLSYFLTNEWHFKDDNTMDIFNKLSDTDKVLFNFDVKSTPWEHYIIMYGLGIRKYIIKDGLKNTERAVRMQFWLKIANVIFLTAYAYLIFKVFYILYNMVRYLV